MIFLGRPWLAFIVAGVFLLLVCNKGLYRSGFVKMTGILWLFFGIYESMLMMTFNITPGSDYFRCDIILIYPILGIMTLLSLLFICLGWRNIV